MSETKGPVVTTQVAGSEGAKAPEAQALKAESVVLTAAEPNGRTAVNPNAPTLVLEKPGVGQAVTVVWIVGTQIDFKFDVKAAKTVVGDGSTTFVFGDGASLKVVGLEVGVPGLPEIPVTLADGAVVNLDDIAPGGQPPAPAAGGNQPGNQGHAATPVDTGDVGSGLLDTGALGYTALSFSVPELVGDTVENILDGEEALLISINDVIVTEGDPLEGGEGNGGEGGGDARFVDDPTTTITFTVSLSAPSTEPVTVKYTVVPGSAVPGIPIQDAGGPEGDYNGGVGALSQVGVGLFKIAENASTPNANFVDGEPSTGFQNGTFTFSEAGTVLLAWGTFNEGDNVVASPLLLDNLRLNGALLEDFDDATLNALFNTAAGFQGFQASDFDGVAPTQGTGLFVFNPNGGGSSAADIETLLGLPPGSLSQLANDGNGSNGVENATVGSVLFVSLTVNAGDVLTFDFDHIAADGNGPGVSFNDFSFFSSSLAGTLETTNDQGIDPLTGTITFAPGETTKTITLNIIDDFLPENTETFTVVLSEPDGADIADDTGVGTILDNDLTLSISDATATEGNPLQVGEGHFLLGDNGDDDGDQTPNIYRIEADGSVSIAVSFAEISDAITELGAETGATFELNESGIVEDAAGNIFFTVDGVGFFDEGETGAFLSENPIFVKLAASGNIEVVVSAADIIEETSNRSDPEDLVMDSNGILYFVNQPEAGNGDGDASEIVKIIDPLGSPVIGTLTNTVALTDALLDEFGGESVEDFKTDVGITISADDSTLFVPFEGDIVVDGEGGATESVAGVFAINAVTGAVESIFSDEQITGPEYITLAPNGDLIVADEGSDQIYRIDPDTGVVTVFVSVSQLFAAGTDPDLEGGIAFDQFGNFYVADESSGTVIKFPAVDPVAGTIDADSGSVFVAKNVLDAISDVSAELNSDLTFVPGGSGGGTGDDPNTTITFTVTLSAASTQAVTVAYTVLPGTAVEGNPSLHEGDYSPIDPLTGTVTFAAGETSKTITLNVVDDFLAENTENFTVVLSDPVGAGIADGTGVGTIFDNDGEGAPSLLISDASAVEGNELTFQFSLTQASQETIVVQLTSTDGGSTGSATTEGTDYPSLDNVLVTFLPGETLHSLSISAFEDSTSEPDERFTVSAAPVSGVVNTSDTGEGLITDNDVSSLIIDNATATEGNTLSFNLSLTNPSSQDLVFEFTTTSGSATEGTDFTSGDTVKVTFLAGQTGATLTINSTEDGLVENTEDFAVTATVVSGNAIAADGAEGFILDDDVAALSLDISDDTTTEGGPLAFNLTLSAAATTTIVVELSTTDGSSGFASTTENADYPSLDGQLVTFLPGQQQQTVSVTTLEDGVFEPTEAFTVSASATLGAVNTADTGRGVITDNEAAPQLTISNATAIEGNQLVFNLTLSNPSAEQIVFEFQTANGLATEGVDFTSGDGLKVTFAPGQTAGTVTIDTIEDSLVEQIEEMNISASVISGTATVANFAEGFIIDDDFNPNLPVGGQASGAVLEAGVEGDAPGSAIDPFSPGSDPSSNSETASGSLNLSFGPDGPAAVGAFTWSSAVTVVDSDDGNAAVALKSDGHAVNTSVSADGLTLSFVIADGPNAGKIVAQLTATPGAGANAGATFSYEQFGNFDHPDEGEAGAADPLQLGFSYSIKDATGDVANGTLAVTVGDDEPSGAIEKSATITSGANAFNLAFLIDVSNSMSEIVDDKGTADPSDDISRLHVALDALASLLNQADQAGAVGPVLVVAFHGANLSAAGPKLSATTFASVDDAIAGFNTFFNQVLSGQTPPLPNFDAIAGGGTFYEGGLDAAADWLKGNLVNNQAVAHPADDVANADNRVFLLTDGGNRNGDGGFNPSFGETEHLYSNVGALTSDIPNLTIRSVGIDMDTAAEQAAPNDAENRLALFTRDLDQTDDNLINGSITLVDSEQGAEAITGGFGNINPTGVITGNLFIDDNGQGVTPGADDLENLVSFTILNGAGAGDDELLTINSSGAVNGVVTRATALGGTIEVDFNTGDFSYTAPANLVTAVDGFSFSIDDGDGDPIGGTLNISLAPGNGIDANAGFETDTLRFWSVAGSVWVSDSAGISGQSEGQFFAVLHTGNDNGLTPSSDRDLPSDSDLESFLGVPGLDLDNALIAGFGATDGSAIKGVFELDPAPSQQFDVSFDWQFLTDQSDTDGSPNDLAFAIIEGQLFLLANSDNVGSPVANVVAGANITVDGQQFINATAFQNDTSFTINDANNDGVVTIAFGVLNGGTASNASALIVDDVQIVPHVV